MAVDDRRDGFTSTTVTTKVAGGGDGVIRKVVTVDAGDSAVTSGDVVQLLYVPPGYYIHGVGANVRTVEDSTLTIDVGLHLESNDSAVDADGFLDGFNAETSGVHMTNAEAYANDRIAITAGTNVTATYNNAADTSVIDYVIFLSEVVTD